jgi:transposase-like protein
MFLTKKPNSKEATTMKKLADKGTRIKRRIEMQAMTEKEIHFEEEMTTIQTLIGLGMKAATDRIQSEFVELVGRHYEHGKAIGPWGSNPGSIYLGDQKVAINVPRARNPRTGEESTLASYARLQSPRVIEDMALRRVINGISMRKYEEAALSIPETFGISRDSVSRRWIRASAKKLAALNERDLSGYDIVAIFLDGKHFSTDHEIIVALGVTITGEKIILGIVETSTENYVVCRDFVRGLIDRGLHADDPMLCIIDGGKGLYKGIKEVLGEQAVIQRCQWHKRENVLRYLPKRRQDEFRRKLQGAYEQPTYELAKKALETIKRELRVINISAVNSLDEGFEETLTLHRLGLFEMLGRSFKTTNAIENVNSLLGIYTDRVDYWKNSEQRQRWVATALLQIEPRLRTVSGYKHLLQLRSAMTLLVGNKKNSELKAAA